MLWSFYVILKTTHLFAGEHHVRVCQLFDGGGDLVVDGPVAHEAEVGRKSTKSIRKCKLNLDSLFISFVFGFIPNPSVVWLWVLRDQCPS